MEPDSSFLDESRNILERHHPNIRLLGSGYESVVFTDDSKVYKIFRKDPEYYRHIGEQLAGRFEGCKHLYGVTFEMLEGHTVFTYDYEPSRSYSGGMESELIETMAEFALCGIVCIDVKPNNFRITPSGLKYIDYGHDLCPYNEPALPPTTCEFSSVPQSCPTLCDPMNHSTPRLPVLHQLPDFTQTHVH